MNSSVSVTAGRAWMRELLETRARDLVSCEPIAMELLAGGQDEPVLARLNRLVNGLQGLPLAPATDFRDAAAIYRAVRRSGRTVRNLTDCMIAAVAIRHGATLVHKDTDYEAIESVTPLQALSLR